MIAQPQKVDYQYPDLFELEWWIPKSEAEGWEHTSLVEDYLKERLPEVFVDEFLQIDFYDSKDQWYVWISTPTNMSGFVLYNAEYVGRMICKMFGLKSCNYTIDNPDGSVHINNEVKA